MEAHTIGNPVKAGKAVRNDRTSARAWTGGTVAALAAKTKKGLAQNEPGLRAATWSAVA
jgi:hypothetical protein